jgi:hypothetical protein
MSAMNPELKPEQGIGTSVLISILGGAARQAHQWLGGRKITLRHFAVRSIISSFVGVICYFALPPTSPWSYAACGLFSWLGADGIALLLNIVVKKNDKEN